MLFAPIALFAGALSAISMLGAQLNPFVEGQMSLTDLGGNTPIFNSSQQYIPGDTPTVEYAHLRLAGPVSSSAAGLYITNFQSKAPSSLSICTAPNPADKFDVTIDEGSQVLYSGTLSDLASEHNSPQTLLPISGGVLKPGQTATIKLSVGLDVSADNPYMGCSVSASLAWYAAQ